MIAQGTISEPLDGHAQDRANNHRPQQHDQAAAQGFGREIPGQVVPGERPDHEDITVGEIDEAQHAINHGVSESDEGIDRTQRNPIDELLEKFAQGLMVSTYLNFPSLTVMTTAGLVALRCSSRVVLPVTPSKPLVAAIASRNFGSSVVPARLIASASTMAESYPNAAIASGVSPFQRLRNFLTNSCTLGDRSSAE